MQRPGDPDADGFPRLRLELGRVVEVTLARLPLPRSHCRRILLPLHRHWRLHLPTEGFRIPPRIRRPRRRRLCRPHRLRATKGEEDLPDFSLHSGATPFKVRGGDELSSTPDALDSARPTEFSDFGLTGSSPDLGSTRPHFLFLF